MKTSVWGPLAFVIGQFAVIAWSLPRSVQGGDAGEFATLMLAGGIAHPPGYPLMRMLGFVSSILHSAGLPACWATAGLCAIMGGLAWFLWAVTSMATTTVLRPEQRMTAVWGITALSTNAAVLNHLYDCEVWGLHLLLCTSCAISCLRRRRIERCALLWGIALAQHLTAALLLPLVIARALDQAKDCPKNEIVPRLVALFVATLKIATISGATAFFLYASLRWSSELGWQWGDTSTWSGWWHHVTRADYGTFSLGLRATKPPLIALWVRHLTVFGDALTLSLAPWATSGVVALGLAMWGAGSPSLGWQPLQRWAYRITLLASGLGFASLGNFDPYAPTSAWILARFDILPIALAMPGYLAAIERVLLLLNRPFLRTSVNAIWLTTFLTLPWSDRGHARPSLEHGVQAYAEDLLATPPTGQKALVFGTDDHRVFPQIYLREVLHRRPDVLFVDAALLPYPWYRLRLQRHWPTLPVAEKPLHMIDAVWADPAWQHTPIYLANIFSKPASTLQRVPEGVLWRIVAPGANMEEFNEHAVVQRHLAAFSRYSAQVDDFAGVVFPEHAAHHPWSRELWPTYVEGTKALVHSLERGGKPELAREVRAAVKAQLGLDTFAASE